MRNLQKTIIGCLIHFTLIQTERSIAQAYCVV